MTPSLYSSLLICNNKDIAAYSHSFHDVWYLWLVGLTTVYHWLQEVGTVNINRDKDVRYKEFEERVPMMDLIKNYRIWKVIVQHKLKLKKAHLWHRAKLIQQKSLNQDMNTMEDKSEHQPAVDEQGAAFIQY